MNMGMNTLLGILVDLEERSEELNDEIIRTRGMDRIKARAKLEVVEELYNAIEETGEAS